MRFLPGNNHLTAVSLENLRLKQVKGKAIISTEDGLDPSKIETHTSFVSVFKFMSLQF